ncbi:AAA family ATPase [Waterburya agarophytonicola K14]|uniref:AAA family ATPase n=1 Tax=Waterburya agarophytonicola KI4 TaxID=2874699 RepID=A0A964BV87_9CYAN|nr:AAA family ATPase [Waterburya agarophytonicola]MCC0178430.1 AAA family ATPase [Waterburya agarophytonicola KI4]
MTQTTLCHLLVGLPSSGKSTFTKQLHQQIPDSVVVSASAIEAELSEREKTKVKWNDIENEVIDRVRLGAKYKQVVIYDANNVRLDRRKSFLDKTSDLDFEWVCWWIKTPVNVCKYWNKRRPIQIPKATIDESYDDLEQSPPTVEEGFVAVREVNP